MSLIRAALLVAGLLGFAACEKLEYFAKNPENLRAIGREALAERAELGKTEHAKLVTYASRLEKMLLGFLKHMPRPTNEKDLFKACGCDPGHQIRRHDQVEVPEDQNKYQLSRFDGRPGWGCTREETRLLPAHNERFCGPPCHNKTKKQHVDPFVDDSYAVICPAPLKPECEYNSAGGHSTCKYPSTLFMPLKDRIALLEHGARSLATGTIGHADVAPRPQATTEADYRTHFQQIEHTLFSVMTAEMIPKPTRTEQERCGCDVDDELSPVTFTQNGPNPLGWLCRHTEQQYDKDFCGPLCKNDNGQKFAMFCPKGMTPRCTGCASPGHQDKVVVAGSSDGSFTARDEL
jgi:hypothetical protein